MITVKLFSYPNSVEIQIFDSSIFTTRNRQVYSRPIKVYQGVDNPIQVIVKNQDQKKVDLTGYALEADIQDPVNRVTVNSYAVTFASNVDLAAGRGSFILDKETLNSLEQRFYKLTFKTVELEMNNPNYLGRSERPVYIDDNFGVPLDLEILPAYYDAVEAVPGVDNSVIDGGIIE